MSSKYLLALGAAAALTFGVSGVFGTVQAAPNATTANDSVAAAITATAPNAAANGSSNGFKAGSGLLGGNGVGVTASSSDAAGLASAIGRTATASAATYAQQLTKVPGYVSGFDANSVYVGRPISKMGITVNNGVFTNTATGTTNATDPAAQAGLAAVAAGQYAWYSDTYVTLNYHVFHYAVAVEAG